MKHSFSEKYRKYLLALNIGNATYYTVSGTDQQDIKNDKLLLDTDGRIIVFKNIDSLSQYIDQAENIFDADNLKKWGAGVSAGQPPYATFNVANLDQVDSLAEGADLYSSTVSFLYLMLDYALQANDTKLKKMLDSEKLVELRSFFVENHEFEERGDRLEYITRLRENPLLQETLTSIKQYFLDSIVVH